MEFVFDLEKNKEKIEEFVSFIQSKKQVEGALIQVLQKAQVTFGYLPEEIIEIIAKELKLPLSEVYGVATFYAQFSFVPLGDNTVSVCLGTACYVKGAKDLLNALKEQLKIAEGETTPDRQFSINVTRCIGACGLAPVMSVNNDVYGRLKVDDIRGILEKYKKVEV